MAQTQLPSGALLFRAAAVRTLFLHCETKIIDQCSPARWRVTPSNLIRQRSWTPKVARGVLDLSSVVQHSEMELKYVHRGFLKRRRFSEFVQRRCSLRNVEGAVEATCYPWVQSDLVITAATCHLLRVLSLSDWIRRLIDGVAVPHKVKIKAMHSSYRRRSIKGRWGEQRVEGGGRGGWLRSTPSLDAINDKSHL
jgi:hypothetical protein